MVSQVNFRGSGVTPMFSNPFKADLDTTLDTGLFNNIAPMTNPLSADTFTASGATPNAGELTNCLVEKDKNIATTEAGNTYKKTNTGKIVGGILGVLAPIASRLITKTAFKFKPVAIACTALGLAGAGIGALVDSFTNSKRAEAADQAQTV